MSCVSSAHLGSVEWVCSLVSTPEPPLSATSSIDLDPDVHRAVPLRGASKLQARRAASFLYPPLAPSSALARLCLREPGPVAASARLTGWLGTALPLQAPARHHVSQWPVSVRCSTSARHLPRPPGVDRYVVPPTDVLLSPTPTAFRRRVDGSAALPRPVALGLVGCRLREAPAVWGHKMVTLADGELSGMSRPRASVGRSAVDAAQYAAQARTQPSR